MPSSEVISKATCSVILYSLYIPIEDILYSVQKPYSVRKSAIMY